MENTFNERVRDAAQRASVWSDPDPYNNFVLCVPWSDELQLLDEMTTGSHGERARTIAYTDGAVAFARWEGFVIAWGSEIFGFVRIEEADKTDVVRALRALLVSTAFKPVTRKDVSS